MEAVGAVILAAGNSSRLGQPKQLLHFRGETLIHRTTRLAENAGFAPVAVVTGGEHEQISEQLATLDARIFHHAEWARGIGSSIRAGVTHLLGIAPSLDALVLMVCDQPFVGAEVLRALISVRAQTGKRAVASAYAGTIGVPAIFDRTLFPLLAAMPDEHGAKSILTALSKDVALVDFPLGTADIDTPADCRAHLDSYSFSAEPKSSA